MVLIRTCSLEALRTNIRAEIAAGKDPSQAAAIAHDTLRRVCRAEGKPVPRSDGADLTMGVLRYDLGDFEVVKRLDNGYLQTTGRLTRVGVFNYVREDGTIRRELRLPEEVFKADALKSFGLSPLTNKHPPEKLTSTNTHRWQVGTIANPREDGAFVTADIQITHEDAIKAAEDGRRQLSCGYHCDLEETAGVHPEFGRYDAIQRNITGNHVAQVSHARGGSDLTIRLDGDDARMIPDGDPPRPAPQPPRSDSMKTRIDSVEYECSEPLSQAVSKLQGKHDEATDQLATTKADLEKEKARADKAAEDLETEKKARTDEGSPEAIRKVVTARVALETTAAKILGEKKEDGTAWKIDEMSDDELRVAVILKATPKAAEKMDGADPVYIQARFDAAVEGWTEKKDAAPRADAFAGVHHASRIHVPEERNDAEASRARMIKDNYDMGRAPFNPAKN